MYILAKTCIHYVCSSFCVNASYTLRNSFSIEQFLCRCAKVSTVMLKLSISFCFSFMKHMLNASCEAEDLDLLILHSISQALGLKEYTSMNGIMCWGPNLWLCGSLESTLSADSHPLIPESLYFRCVFPPRANRVYFSNPSL